ncbi:hypothetical protein D3C80_1940820 [compost metagenome]
MHDNSHDGCTVHAKGRKAEVSQHQTIGQHTIYQECEDGDVENDAGLADGTDQATHDIKQQARKQAIHGDAKIIPCQL